MGIQCVGVAACLLVGSAVQAQTCESISAQIETKIRASGGSGNFKLAILDTGEATSGRVVGNCGQGSKKIVYSVTGGNPVVARPASGAVAAAQPARPRSAPRPEDNILTECKDGTMAVGATCGR